MWILDGELEKRGQPIRSQSLQEVGDGTAVMQGTLRCPKTDGAGEKYIYVSATPVSIPFFSHDLTNHHGLGWKQPPFFSLNVHRGLYVELFRRQDIVGGHSNDSIACGQT